MWERKENLFGKQQMEAQRTPSTAGPEVTCERERGKDFPFNKTVGELCPQGRVEFPEEIEGMFKSRLTKTRLLVLHRPQGALGVKVS